MHHVQVKALASLISTFLQTAANPRFQQSLYHSILYRYHCLQDETVPKFDLPPYYSREFFNTIKEVVENSPLNPVHMNVKQWYSYLLEKKVTMETIDEEGRMKTKVCKIEERFHDVDWQHSYSLARLKGLSPQVKSLNFKLIHQILPVKERLSHILPATSPSCLLCRTQEPESIIHVFFECVKVQEAADYIIKLSRVYDPVISKEKITRLQVHTQMLYELPTMVILCSGLDLIWRNRLRKQGTRLYEIRAELESQVLALRKSRSKKLREAGNMFPTPLKISLFKVVV